MRPRTILWALGIALSLIGASVATAQELVGRVVDSTTEWGLSAVTIQVTILATGDQIVTGTHDDGTFRVADLPCGGIHLEISAPEYEPESRQFMFDCTDHNVDLVISLTPVAHNLEDLVVSTRRSGQEPTRRELDRDVIEKLPGFGGDAIKSIQALPGVARPSVFNPAAIIVRGSGVFDTRYLLDGVDIPLLFHYGGIKSTYNTQALSRVDLYPGGFNTRYGGSVGGVVEITGRPGRIDSWYREFDVSLLDAAALIEGPVGENISVLLNVRRSYAGEMLDRALSGQDDLKLAVVPYYWDVIGRVDWTPTAQDEVFVTFFAAKDRMELVFPDEDLGSSDVSDATDAIDMSLQFHRLILGYDRQVNTDLRNQLRFAVGTSKDKGNTFGYFRFESEAPITTVRDQLTWRMSDAVIINGGVDMIWAPVKYDVEVVGWPGSLAENTFSDLGVYANADWHVSDCLTLMPGLRYDYYTHLDEGSPSVRLTGRYRLNDRHTLTGAVGTYNQGPQPIGQSTDPVYGNPDLPPTVATHFVLGDEFLLTDRWHAKVEGYYNVQDNIPALAEEPGQAFLADADGRMYGFELMLRYQGSDRFFGWLAYGLSKSERRYARQPSLNLTIWSPDDWVPYEYDQPHHLEAVGSWTLGRGWSCGGRLQYVSGNPDTPILGYTSNIYVFNADTGAYEPVSGEYLSERLDPYVRLDIRIDKAFHMWGADCSFYLDVQNLSSLIYDSPEGYVYNYDYSKRKAYGGIILPALGLRVAF